MDSLGAKPTVCVLTSASVRPPTLDQRIRLHVSLEIASILAKKWHPRTNSSRLYQVILSIPCGLRLGNAPTPLSAIFVLLLCALLLLGLYSKASVYAEEFNK